MISTVPRFDRSLVKKYDRSGPRYTSYPTALQFSPAADPAELLDDCRNTPGPLSVYVHLPFCESLCWFCACTTVITLDQGKADAYLDRLEREIDLMDPHLPSDRSLAQLHLGGGSPSFLSAPQIARLGRILGASFTPAPEPEFSAELDPRTLNEEKVDVLRSIGFTRASFGVQDVNPEVQLAIHRVQPDAMNRKVLAWVRGAGFESVNIDLVYGLPKQTTATFANTLDAALDYAPDRIALFSYAHVPWVAPAQKIVERSVLPSAEEKLDLLEMAVERLTGAGYVFIGMDHFAKADDPLAIAAANGTLHRNFQGYSTRGDLNLSAFGMSSISQSARAYRQNQKDLRDYSDAVDNGRLPVARGYRLTPRDELRRTVIMELMCRFRLDLDKAGADHGVDVREEFAAARKNLTPMEEDGLVEWDGNTLAVTPPGRFIIRNIAMAFDTYARPAENRHARTI
ncbi:MAG: oxygen-independent coproporphyrinogen III oxidase [Opitutales bacterium]|nr:oxygen-independent coproporphyrinogen III oxidase [Opitutales bacterium]